MTAGHAVPCSGGATGSTPCAEPTRRGRGPQARRSPGSGEFPARLRTRLSPRRQAPGFTAAPLTGYSSLGTPADEVIDWCDGTAAGIERTVMPSSAHTFALTRWVAHGYGSDPTALGDNGSWTQLNERDLAEVELPVLPDGGSGAAPLMRPDRRPRSRPMWTPGRPPRRPRATRVSGRRRGYRGDLHLLVKAPDGTMATSTIMWLDEVNRTVEFEPVGRIRIIGVWGWEGRCCCRGCVWRGRPGPLMRPSPVWGRRGIRRRAGCTTVRVPGVHARRATRQSGTRALTPL